MQIKALKSFSDGAISLGIGEVATVSDAKATAFITEGLAESASLNIGANGTYDVADKASAVVSVGTATVTYNVNGGTGTVANAVAIKGNTITLNDGTSITAPKDKTFKGWGVNAEATDVVASPYTVAEDVTLYAVYQ